MARSHLRYTVKDRAGNVVQNAKVYVYETGTTTAVDDLYAAATGGSAVTFLTSNAQGDVEGWLTTPKAVDLKVTDNGDTAYYPSEPSTPRSWTDFTETVEVRRNPANDNTVYALDYIAGPTTTYLYPTLGTDFLEMFNDARDALPSAGGKIVVGAGPFYSSGEIESDRLIQWEGAGGGYHNTTKAGTTIIFPNGSNGFTFPANTAQFASMRGILVQGLTRPEGGAAVGSGVVIESNSMTLWDVNVQGFGRHGYLVDTDPSFANANLTEFHHCRAFQNGVDATGHGWYLNGNDANVVKWFGCDATQNAGWGAYLEAGVANCVQVGFHSGGNGVGYVFCDGQSNQFYAPYAEGAEALEFGPNSNHNFAIIGPWGGPSPVNHGSNNHYHYNGVWNRVAAGSNTAEPVFVVNPNDGSITLGYNGVGIKLHYEGNYVADHGTVNAGATKKIVVNLPTDKAASLTAPRVTPLVNMPDGIVWNSRPIYPDQVEIRCWNITASPIVVGSNTWRVGWELH